MNIPCVIVFCKRKAWAKEEGDENLCPKHWKVGSGPIRRRYEAAWDEATKADNLCEPDFDAQIRASAAWDELVAYVAKLDSPAVQ